MKTPTKKLILAGLVACGVLFSLVNRESVSYDSDIQKFKVKRHSFSIDVRAIGELEAANSTSISSVIKSDNGKIIYIVPDGANVQKGEILVKLDPTPFEEKLEALKNKFKEQEGYVAAVQKNLEWEISQAERDEKTAYFEIESAELELNKVLQGDGPLEKARLKGAMNKALSKFEEFGGYCGDLEELEAQGFLNPVEIKNAQKKLADEQECYDAAKLQYESYVQHVYPMQVKKAETLLKQARVKQEETAKIRGHSIGKALLEQSQAFQNLEIIKHQCSEAEKDLRLTDIKAGSPGMVVHKEDYRGGQRRKPRIGDVLVRNQIILDLPDLNAMTVKSKVREIDLCKVEVGKNASIEIDAYPQLQFTGKITAIGVLALPDPGKPTDEKYFEIRVLLDESDPRVRPGMTARVVIHTADLENVMTVPIHALFYDQQKAYCYVEAPFGFEKREVALGTGNEEWVEIKSGLKEGENICLAMPKENRS